jgi:hypothetical protein
MKSKSRSKKETMKTKPLYFIIPIFDDKTELSFGYINDEYLYATPDREEATKTMNQYAEDYPRNFEKRMETYKNYNWFEKMFHNEPKMTISGFRVVEIQVDKSVDLSPSPGKSIWFDEATGEASNIKSEKYWVAIGIQEFIGSRPEEI